MGSAEPAQARVPPRSRRERRRGVAGGATRMLPESAGLVRAMPDRDELERPMNLAARRSMDFWARTSGWSRASSSLTGSTGVRSPNCSNRARAMGTGAGASRTPAAWAPTPPVDGAQPASPGDIDREGPCRHARHRQRHGFGSSPRPGQWRCSERRRGSLLSPSHTARRTRRGDRDRAARRRGSARDHGPWWWRAHRPDFGVLLAATP